MAFHFRQLHGLRLIIKRARARYHLPAITTCLYYSSSSAWSFNQINNNNQSNVDERRLLTEISQLFRLPRSYDTVPNLYRDSYPPPKQTESRTAVDEFLLPEEKLRGVFLQKLRGKTAIENALSNVPVELTLDVIAKVVNSRWGLGGEAMVLFFNWAIKQPGIPRHIHSYNIIVKALGRRKFFNFMTEILHDMVQQGGALTPDLETLSIVIDCYIRARRVHKAIDTFDNLERLGLKRDTQSLNVILQCLCRRSHLGAANSLFGALGGKLEFDRSTYNIMISGWSRVGAVSEMERILKAMTADGFTPDCLTFSFIIEGLGRAGKIDDAIEVFDHIKETGCTLDTRVYNAMISNFISIGNFDECRKYYKGLLDSNSIPDTDTYTKLISAFLKARKVADALETFDEMLVRGIVPTTGTLTSFIEPLCSYGPPHAAMVFYKKARKFGCKVSLTAYKLLLKRLSRFGKCGMLLDVWDEMQESGHISDMEVYEHVINGLCNIGHLENAVLVMEEALHKGFCPSRLIYSKLNHKLLASNEVEKAYKLFLKIKDARRNEIARRYWRANGWHF